MNDDEQSPNAQLARLADESASPRERTRMLAEVNDSPERAAELDEQRRAVALLRSIDVTAPESLRNRTEALMRPAAKTPRRRARHRRLVPVAGALAPVIAAAAIILSLGTAAPTIAQATRLALSPATLPAPRPDRSHPALLALRAGGIPFPNYLRSIGWEAVGARRDELHGREITTVFYANRSGDRVGYAIVAGSALAQPAGTVRTVAGVPFTLTRLDRGTLVTWRRAGRTCIIAGRTTSNATLLALAVADERTA